MITLSVRELAKIAIEGMGAMQKQKELEGLLWKLEEVVALGRSRHTMSLRNNPTESEPVRFLEIGVGNGGTTWALSKLVGVSTFVSIDLPAGPFSQGAIPKECLEYIRGNACCEYFYIPGDSKSEEIRDRAAALVDGDVDFLFIDGDHTYQGVKSDFEMYSPLVRQGGLIALHDIVEHAPESGCEVKKFWDELKEKLPSTSVEEIIDPEGGAWAGVGIVHV